MKKSLLLLIWLCSTSSLLFAQDFGKTLVTGSISFSTEKHSISMGNLQEQTRNTFSIRPQVGFFVSPSVAVGVSAGYTREYFSDPYSNPYYYQGSTYDIPVEWTTNQYSAGPFLRIYTSITPKIAFFGHGEAYYQTGKTVSDRDFSNLPPSPNITWDTTEPSFTQKGGGFKLQPGIVFFPTNTIGIEATVGNVGYFSSKSETEGSNYSSKSSGFNANFGLSSVSLGISLYLGRTASE
jgi:hypothetical protein